MFHQKNTIVKKIERSNLTIALNVLYAKKANVYPTYVSKHNSNHGKQVTLLMIPNGKICYYVAVKKLSVLLRRITSKHQGDFYCLNCLRSFSTENKRESHKKVCENKDIMKCL